MIVQMIDFVIVRFGCKLNKYSVHVYMYQYHHHPLLSKKFQSTRRVQLLFYLSKGKL